MRRGLLFDLRSSANCIMRALKLCSLEVDPSRDLHIPWTVIDCARYSESDRLRGVAGLLVG